MPQRGGLRLSVFALTCAVGLVTAASASAKDVVMEAGAMHVAPGSSATVRVPPGLVLKQALITRSTTFPEGVDGSYSATFKWYTGPQSHRDPIHAQVIDSATTSVNGDVTAAAPANEIGSDGQLVFDVTGAGAVADVQRLGLVFDDAFDPTAAIGGIGPGNNVSNPVVKDENGQTSILPADVSVWASDVGAGLWKAELYVDDRLVGTLEYVDADGTGRNCVDALNRGAPLPVNNDCLHSYSGETAKPIKFDSTTWPDGSPLPDGKHTATVKLYDAAGRIAEPVKDAEFTITNHPITCGNPCDRPLSIGSGSSSQQTGGSNGGNGSGGVAGESATSCTSPRLSMELSQKPLKVSKGVLVLRSGKRYRFRGKLTCLVGTKRRSAPVKTPIELFNTIGKRTYRKGGATVRANGKITIILAYKSSRTLVFRYTNPDGRRSQVKLKIKVVKTSR